MGPGITVSFLRSSESHLTTCCSYLNADLLSEDRRQGAYTARIAQLAAVIARAILCSSTSVPPRIKVTTLESQLIHLI